MALRADASVSVRPIVTDVQRHGYGMKLKVAALPLISDACAPQPSSRQLKYATGAFA